MKTAIIGTSFAGGLHAESYGRDPRVTVAACADKDEGRLKSFAVRHSIPQTFTDYRELLSSSDAEMVSVCMPNFLHHEVVIEALRAKRHVVCEKPLATKVVDAREMVEEARRAGVRLFYAEDWVFAPALRRAREIVSEGGLGKVLYVKAKETHSGSHSVYAQKKEYGGGGAMIHLGVHPVGFLTALFGKLPCRIVASVSGGGDGNLAHKNYTGEDWSAAVFEYEGGERALVEGNYITVGGLDDIVEIYGTDGVIKVDLSQGSPLKVYSRPGYSYAIEKTDSTVGWTRPAVDELRSLGYPDELRHFVDCVEKGIETERGARGTDGLDALRVIEAIYRSAETGRAVGVEE